MDLPKKYNIKMEDKAAFVNKASALGFEIDSFDVKDDKLTNTFSITVNTPQEVEIVKYVLKSSPHIDDVREMVKKAIKEEIKKHLEK
jgi:cell division protein FtsX